MEKVIKLGVIFLILNSAYAGVLVDSEASFKIDTEKENSQVDGGNKDLDLVDSKASFKIGTEKGNSQVDGADKDLVDSKVSFKIGTGKGDYQVDGGDKDKALSLSFKKGGVNLYLETVFAPPVKLGVEGVYVKKDNVDIENFGSYYYKKAKVELKDIKGYIGTYKEGNLFKYLIIGSGLGFEVRNINYKVGDDDSKKIKLVYPYLEITLGGKYKNFFVKANYKFMNFESKDDDDKIDYKVDYKNLKINVGYQKGFKILGIPNTLALKIGYEKEYIENYKDNKLKYYSDNNGLVVGIEFQSSF